MLKVTGTLLQGIVAALLTTVIFSPASLHAQENLSIDQAICISLSQNNQIQASKEKIASQEYNVKSSLTDMLPKFSFSGQYVHMEPLPEFKFNMNNLFHWENAPPGDITLQMMKESMEKMVKYNIIDMGSISQLKVYEYNQWQASFSVQQPLFSIYPLLEAYKIQKNGLEMTRFAEKTTGQDIRMQVIVTYLSALEAKKLIQIANEAVDLIKQNVDQAKLFVQAGVAQISDQLMAEVRLAEAKNNVVRAENALKLAKASINMLMGANPRNEFQLVDLGMDIPKFTSTMDEMLSSAERNRSELKLLDNQVEITKRGIRLAWSNFIPQSGIFGSYTYQVGNDFMPEWGWAAGASASIPIWEWGKRYDQIKSAEHTYKEAKNQRDYARDGIELQVKQAYLDLVAAEKMIATSEASMKASRESHRVMKMKYDAQMTTMVELLEATLMVSRSDFDYYTAVYEYAKSLVRLARSAETDASKISSAKELGSECRLTSAVMTK